MNKEKETELLPWILVSVVLIVSLLCIILTVLQNNSNKINTYEDCMKQLGSYYNSVLFNHQFCNVKENINQFEKASELNLKTMYNNCQKYIP